MARRCYTRLLNFSAWRPQMRAFPKILTAHLTVVTREPQIILRGMRAEHSFRASPVSAPSRSHRLVRRLRLHYTRQGGTDKHADGQLKKGAGAITEGQEASSHAEFASSADPTNRTSFFRQRTGCVPKACVSELLRSK